ncbi:MAG: hypothetical protein H6R04_1169 [Burkholderiaceae bacterium]|nr:hypothetical protein [Burkholderiaceae bacterium]
MYMAAWIALFVAPAAYAHHGVAGVGAAALEGPGAPVESASSAVLPEGKVLLYAKLDHARFKSVNPSDTQVNYNQFWMAGVGYGFTPWFSAYAFAPYNRKIDTAEPAGAATPKFNTSGLADMSLMGQIGFKYDKGFRLVPANESLDDLEDWHFTVYGGGSLPSGNPNLKNREGNIDPGKSTSFGKPDWSVGFTATKMLSSNLTFNTELSTIRFLKYRYRADTAHPNGFDAQFGAEDRLNLGLAYRVYTNPAQKLRVDFSLETQFLKIARDRENGIGQEATGGKILYLLPGIRVYKDNMSFAFGVKKVAWKRLNEDALQQGSEGKEKYRLILSASGIF